MAAQNSQLEPVLAQFAVHSGTKPEHEKQRRTAIFLSGSDRLGPADAASQLSSNQQDMHLFAEVYSSGQVGPMQHGSLACVLEPIS